MIANCWSGRSGDRIRRLVLIATLWPVSGLAWSGGVEVRGRVFELDSGAPARVPGAVVEFRSAGGGDPGHTVAVKTNQLGDYNVLLDPGIDYAVTVTLSYFCPVHRPPFRLSPGPAVRFDFTLTTHHPPTPEIFGELPAPGQPTREMYYDLYSGIPFYFEEEIPARENSGGPSAIIAFGTRRNGETRRGYASLPIEGHPGVHLPVTVSFGTYTVRGDTALLDRNTRVLTVQGNVQVEDGRDAPPTAAPCATVRLDSLEVDLHSCQAQGSGPAR